MTEKEKKIKAAYRLEFVTAYLYGNICAAEFVELVNTGKVFKRLHFKTGNVSAKELERWINICMGVLDEK